MLDKNTFGDSPAAETLVKMLTVNELNKNQLHSDEVNSIEEINNHTSSIDGSVVSKSLTLSERWKSYNSAFGRRHC